MNSHRRGCRGRRRRGRKRRRGPAAPRHPRSRGWRRSRRAVHSPRRGGSRRARSRCTRRPPAARGKRVRAGGGCALGRRVECGQVVAVHSAGGSRGGPTDSPAVGVIVSLGDALLARSCSCGWRATCLPTASCGRCATGGSVRACESKITARATMSAWRCRTVACRRDLGCEWGWRCARAALSAGRTRGGGMHGTRAGNRGGGKNRQRF